MERNKIVLALLLVSTVHVACAADNESLRKDMEKMRWNSGRLRQSGSWLTGKDGFPPAVYLDKNGKPTVSWRLTFRQYLNPDPPQMDQPWNSFANREFDTQYGRNNFALRAPVNLEGQPEHTSILALVGQGTAFTEFEAEKNVDFSKLPDDAILLLESKNKKIHWMEPGDITLDELLNSKSLTGIGDLQPNYPNGYLVAFADGAVWYIKKEVPREAISKFYTVESAREFDREKVLGPYALDKISSIKEYEREEEAKLNAQHSDDGED